jgi:uncharacterized protein YutE (UPF0331/DUF86 family)
LVDKILLGRKLADLETYLVQLKEFADISEADYRKNWKTQRIVERTLQIVIETSIDIANHLISDRGLRMPTGYADTFQILAENKILAEKLSSNLQKMAKFRNIIVHQYEDINPRIVTAILRNNLKDLEQFRKAITKILSG